MFHDYELSSIISRNSGRGILKFDDVQYPIRILKLDFEPDSLTTFEGDVIGPGIKIDSSRPRLYLGSDQNLEIERVIFNDPATIVIWKDGTKTVVKCQEGDVYDAEKGLALCISKKALGNKGNFNEVFKKWVPQELETKESKSRESADGLYGLLKGLKTIHEASKKIGFVAGQGESKSLKKEPDIIIEGMTEISPKVLKMLEEGLSEKPLYNGRVRCIETDHTMLFTVGKIYDVVDGRLRYDDGDLSILQSHERPTTFKEFQKMFSSKFEEVKELGVEGMKLELRRYCHSRKSSCADCRLRNQTCTVSIMTNDEIKEAYKLVFENKEEK